MLYTLHCLLRATAGWCASFCCSCHFHYTFSTQCEFQAHSHCVGESCKHWNCTTFFICIPIATGLKKLLFRPVVRTAYKFLFFFLIKLPVIGNYRVNEIIPLYSCCSQRWFCLVGKYKSKTHFNKKVRYKSSLHWLCWEKLLFGASPNATFNCCVVKLFLGAEQLWLD